MAVSIYDKVLPWDPINYFSIESNLGKDRLDRRQKQADDLSKMQEVAIPHGPATRGVANKLQTEVVNPALDDITKSIQAGEDPFIIAKKKRSLQQSLKENPLYWDAINDAEYQRVNDMWKTVANPEFGNNLQEFYSPDAGFTQHDPNKGRFNPQTHYSNVPIVGINEDPGIVSLFSRIKPEIKNQWGNPYESFSYGPNGEIIGAYRTTEGIRTEKIDKNTIRNAFADLALNDPTFVDQYASLRYKRAYNNKQARDKGIDYQYTPEQVLEDLSDAYIGKYSNSQDLNPKIQNIPGYPRRGKTGSGNESDQNLPLNPFDNVLVQLNDTGTANTSFPEVIAATLGQGTYNKDKNTITADVSGTDTYVALGSTPDGKFDERSLRLSILAPKLGALNSLIDRKYKGAAEIRLREQYPDIAEFDPGFGGTTFSKDPRAESEVPNKIDEILKNTSDRGTKKIVAEAKMLGYDLTNRADRARLTNDIKASTPQLEDLASSGALTMNDLKKVTLNPTEGVQYLTADNGEVYQVFNGSVSDPQGELADKLESLLKANKATVREDVEGDKEFKTYEFPVIKKVEGDIGDMSLRSFKDTWGTSKETMITAPDVVNRSKSLASSIKNKARYTSESFAEGISSDITSKIRSLEASDSDTAKTNANAFSSLYANLMQQYEAAFRAGDEMKIADIGQKLDALAQEVALPQYK